MSVEVVTFGCRLNAFESEVIRREAERAGLSDTIVINSCAVTNEAVAQARQSIRRLKRERPDARIVVTGCAAQTQRKCSPTWPRSTASSATTTRCAARPGARRARRSTRVLRDEKIAVTDIMSVKEMAPHLVDGFQRGLPRVFVQVQNGCDHRCTFCIIPYGRGNSRSVPMGAVVEQVRALIERGHAEIVLTGVDLTSYGADLPGAPKLGMLTKQILRHVPELKRLRISSIDSIEADRDLLDVIADDGRLMPHLHLSLQSGDDMILKRMKRRHLRQDAIEFCAQVRRLRPDIALGADIIAGFPTETEEMFARSQDLVEECGLTFLHVFPYSKRPGTPACADAAGRGRRDQGTREAIARHGRGGIAQAAGFRNRRGARRADRKRDAGRTEHFCAGGDLRQQAAVRANAVERRCHGGA